MSWPTEWSLRDGEAGEPGAQCSAIKWNGNVGVSRGIVGGSTFKEPEGVFGRQFRRQQFDFRHKYVGIVIVDGAP
ncbi:MAG: hypothetical protein ACM3SX_01770 [Deltaproteobacteria bacterium]